MRLMTSEQTPKSATTEALKRALEAKKHAQGLSGGGGMDAKSLEKNMQRQAAALNKPAFKRMSKRG